MERKVSGSNKRIRTFQVLARLTEEEGAEFARLAEAQGIRPGTLARTVLSRYIKQSSKRGTANDAAT
jgi:hypothetical protein